MKKAALTLALFALTFFSAKAQYFDWVQTLGGYDGASSLGTKMGGAMTDADGNLYVCSSYGWGASICDEPLLDSSYGHGQNMVVAKISVDGELVWHREVYGQVAPVGVRGLLPLGDTAFTVCFSLSTPWDRYWVDFFGTRYGGYGSQYTDFATLFDGPDHLQFSNLHLLCFVTFNLDGEITEMHFLASSLLDADGNPFTGASFFSPRDSNVIYITGGAIYPRALTVDHQGNIILTTMSITDIGVPERCDTCQDGYRMVELSTENGGVSGIRYYVDGSPVYDFMLPRQTGDWNAYIMKFTPHLGSVAFCHYIAYDTVGDGGSENEIFSLYGSQYLESDPDGNIYLCGSVEAPSFGPLVDTYVVIDSLDSCSSHTVQIFDSTYYRDILLDSLQPSLRIHAGHGLSLPSYVLKYTPEGALQWLFQPETELVERDPYYQKTSGGCWNSALRFDASDNSLYLLTQFDAGFFLDDVHDVNYHFGPGDTEDHLYKGAGFIRLDPRDGTYLSSACAPTPEGSQANSDFDVQNGHVVMQLHYHRSLVGIDTIYNERRGNYHPAMIHFDKNGNVLEVINLKDDIKYAEDGRCLLRDSILYLMGCFSDSVSRICGIPLAPGHKADYFIKYVNPAFLNGNAGIRNVDDSNPIVVYSENGRIVVKDAEGETVRVFDIMGRQLIERKINNSHFDIQSSTLAKGVYLVKVGTRPAQKIVVIRN